MFFYILNIFLQDNRLTLYGEITNWSLLGVKVLNVDCYYLNDIWYLNCHICTFCIEDGDFQGFSTNLN